MFRTIGGPEIAAIFVGLCVILIPTIFYLLTLQRTLERCTPESRAMSPGTVWLLLIPLFNIIWQFFVVINMATSLRNEFIKRNLTGGDGDFSRTLGLAFCILSVLSAIPIVGFVFGIAGFICWIVYWVKIAGYSRMLQPPLLVVTG